MKLGIMQPYFFPYIGYYQVIAAVDKFILYDNLSYIKKGWINKNRILVVSRAPIYLIVPIKDKSSFRKICDIEMSNQNPWRKKMLNDIFFNYKNAPFFEEGYPLIEQVINSEYKYLTELNAKSIIDVSRYLRIKTEIKTDIRKYILLEERLALMKDELNESFHLDKMDKPARKVKRILEICKEEGFDEYVNPIGGQNLYNKEEFARNGINLSFVKTGDIMYPQQSKNFYADLSIIDVLMNCGKEGTINLIKNHTLI